MQYHVRVIRIYKWVPRKWLPCLSRKETVQKIDENIVVTLRSLNDGHVVELALKARGYTIGRKQFVEVKRAKK